MGKKRNCWSLVDSRRCIIILLSWPSRDRAAVLVIHRNFERSTIFGGKHSMLSKQVAKSQFMLFFRLRTHPTEGIIHAVYSLSLSRDWQLTINWTLTKFAYTFVSPMCRSTLACLVWQNVTSFSAGWWFMFHHRSTARRAKERDLAS